MLGTVVGTVVMCVAQGWILRRELAGIEGARLVSTVVRMLAAAALLGAVAYFTWKGLDDALGRSFAGQAVSVLTAIAAGVVGLRRRRVGAARARGAADPPAARWSRQARNAGPSDPCGC